MKRILFFAFLISFGIPASFQSITLLAKSSEGESNVYKNQEMISNDTLEAPQKLVQLMNELAEGENNPLLKRHFETVARFTMDTSNGFQISQEDMANALDVLEFFKGEGSKYETYVNDPRPLMMSFKSPTDGEYSFYWLFLPTDFDESKTDYPFYMELHGSGGGRNNNPRKMLYHPLQPEIAGVTSQGFRKEGLYIYPWGRGDKRYQGIAEKDIFEVLNDFDSMFKTDPKRQYLYGFSMGGAGTFRIAEKSLDRWTAIGIYSGAMRNPTLESAMKFRDIPVWMTWGEQEKRLTEVNNKLKDLFLEAGVELKWQVVKGVGHNYLKEYQEDLMDWFKKHVKE